jgi:hypothetical protein
MNEALKQMTYEVELKPGEKLTLPAGLVANVGTGRWVITVEPAPATTTRGHGAFLNGYDTGDEGLYDDAAAR